MIVSQVVSNGTAPIVPCEADLVVSQTANKLTDIISKRAFIVAGNRLFTIPESAQVRHKVHDMIAAVVYGTLVVALVQGTLGGLMFWWLGLPAPLLWAAVMALVAVLPLFGAAIVWVPAAVFLLIDGHWEKALILTLWGSIVIGLIDNFLYPLLMKNKLSMHTVPVFIAAMGGLLVFGATGIVLGPLVLAVAIALLDVWHRRMQLHEIEIGVNDESPR